jgi:hypothetical protein
MAVFRVIQNSGDNLLPAFLQVCMRTFYPIVQVLQIERHAGGVLSLRELVWFGERASRDPPANFLTGNAA